eukprot:5560586-Pleurochrysis_carterae.AAC.1
MWREARKARTDVCTSGAARRVGCALERKGRFTGWTSMRSDMKTMERSRPAMTRMKTMRAGMSSR